MSDAERAAQAGKKRGQTRVFSDQMQYACPTCGKGFQQQHAVAGHTRHCVRRHVELQGGQEASPDYIAEARRHCSQKRARLADSSASETLFSVCWDAADTSLSCTNALEHETEMTLVEASSSHYAVDHEDGRALQGIANEEVVASISSSSHGGGIQAEDVTSQQRLDSDDVAVCEDLLLFQQHLLHLSADKVRKEMHMNRVRAPTTGELASVLWEDCLAVHSFVHENALSENVGDRLLSLVRDIQSRHHVWTPLPRSFRTLRRAVARHLDLNRLPSTVFNVKMSDILPSFNGEGAELIVATGVRFKVMELISELLLSHNASSSLPENQTICFEPENRRSAADDIRVFEDFHTADFYNSATVQLRCKVEQGDRIGPHVHVLPLILSYDKTHVAGGSGGDGAARHCTPVYVALANVKQSILSKQDLYVVCLGYLPEMELSDPELETMLARAGQKAKSKRQRIIRYMKQAVEQAYIDDIISEVNSYSKSGALLQVGCGSECTVFHLYPTISHMSLDNEGGAHALAIYTGNSCARPCRVCTKPIQHFHQPGRCYPVRCDRRHAQVLEAAEDAFLNTCMIRGRVRATEEQQESLRCLKQLSTHPILPAIIKRTRNHPYLQFNGYLCAPPDEMHTVLGGLVKNWIVWTATLVTECGKLVPSLHNNMGVLDTRLKSFPVAHLPAVLRRFSFKKGFSSLIKSAVRTKRARSNVTAGLGGLNHQKLPHLVLQLLVAIGVRGDVLPIGHKWAQGGHRELLNRYCPTELVLTAGFAALDLHYTLHRSSFTEAHLDRLPAVIASCQLHQLRLFGLKQVLVGSSKNYGGIKLHILEHYPQFIRLYGVPKYFDMIAFERAHKRYAKLIFKRTSGRHEQIAQKMLQKGLCMSPSIKMHLMMIEEDYCESRMLRVQNQHSTSERARGNHTRSEDDEVVSSDDATSETVTSRQKNCQKIGSFGCRYETGERIVFASLSRGRTLSVYRDSMGRWSSLDTRTTVHSDIQDYLHPCLGSNVSDVLRLWRKDEQDVDLCNAYDCAMAQGSRDLVFRFLSGIKIDGTPQNLPIIHLYTTRRYRHDRSHGGNVTQSSSRSLEPRFDFVEVNVTQNYEHSGTPPSARNCAQLGGTFCVLHKGVLKGMWAIFLYLQQLTVEHEPKWGSKTLFSFFTYEPNKDKRVHRQVLPVDVIKCPAFILPESCKLEDMHRPSGPDILQKKFVGMDYYFFDRRLVDDVTSFLGKSSTYSATRKRDLPVFVPDASVPAFQRRVLPAFIADSFVDVEEKDPFDDRDLYLHAETGSLTDTDTEQDSVIRSDAGEEDIDDSSTYDAH